MAAHQAIHRDGQESVVVKQRPRTSTRQSEIATPLIHRAAVVSQAFGHPRALSPGHVLAMQQTVGNRAVQRMVAGAAPRDVVQAQGDLEEEELLQGKFDTPTTQLQTDGSPAENQTGLPDALKSGLESLSGLDLSGVRVHYNSAKPAQLNALAYAQGQQIHLGPRQERHLPHEGWHTVQQMQGRVRPTMQTKGVAINDDSALEHEADVMGLKALEPGNQSQQPLAEKHAESSRPAQFRATTDQGVAQRAGVVQRAGTKPRAFAESGKYMVKLSSTREKYVYQSAADSGLSAILPGYHRVTHYAHKNVKKAGVRGLFGGTETIITRVKTSDLGWLRLDSRMIPPGPGQEILVIDTLGYEDPGAVRPVASKEEKVMLDIKLGTYTKSGEQFKLEGAGGGKQFGKKIEHNFKDKFQRDSRAFGVDIEGESKLLKMARATKTLGGRPSTNFQAAMTKVINEIRVVATTMQAAPMTFVGSSIFVVVNLRNPQNSTAKLIDPDHPIVTGGFQSLVARPNNVMDRGRYDAGNPGATRTYDDYSQKWQDSFNTGATNITNYFTNVRRASHPRSRERL